MRISLSLVLAASLTLGACGVVRDSALNPSNWFGRSTSVDPAADAGPVNPLIPATRGGLFASRNAPVDYTGKPFDEIVDLTVERVPGGAIIRATGRAARQGSYLVQLTPATEDETPVDGVLTYRLEGLKPDAATAIGTPATREVTAARHITDQDLRGVRTIRVEGLRNARVARR
jgi:hypothetical protein